MSDSGLDYDKIRERAEKRVKMQQEFKLHLIVYVVVNLFLWFLWLFIPSVLSGLDITGRFASILQFPWPLLVMLCWGVGLVIHGVVVHFEAGGGAEARERAVAKEVERERALRSGESTSGTRWRRAMGYEDSTSEKPKRGARLSDDGELVYDEEDGAEEKPAPEQRRRSSKS